MATYYYDSSIGEEAPDIVDGPVPNVAALQARITELETFIRDEYVTPAQARKDADAATVDGQAELDKAGAIGITP